MICGKRRQEPIGTLGCNKSANIVSSASWGEVGWESYMRPSRNLFSDA